MNVAIKVKDFFVDVAPSLDPYKNTFADALQFQPVVFLRAEFSKELSSGKTFDLDLQTSVSSRFYSVGPEIDTAQFCSS